MYWSVDENSPIKPSKSAPCFVGEIWSINPISWIDLEILSLSISSSVSFGRLYLSENLTISTKQLNLWV